VFAGERTSVATTSNLVIGDPPEFAGAANATDTELDPGAPFATTAVGAPGVAYATIGSDGTEADPVPASLRAATVNV